MKKLILASQSPRRSEILKKAGYYFVSFPVHVSEIPDKNLNLDEQIIDIAGRKAIACFNKLHSEDQVESLDGVVLAADTLVCLDNVTIGKPQNEQNAFETLLKLSGRVHQVKTALFLIDLKTQKKVSLIETTDVHFKKLNESEIKNYISTKEPLDKAGSYAIQGLGGAFVEKFTGDFNNVVGLPLQALEKLFKLNQWEFQKLPVTK